jgi:hypothetical protein
MFLKKTENEDRIIIRIESKIRNHQERYGKYPNRLFLGKKEVFELIVYFDMGSLSCFPKNHYIIYKDIEVFFVPVSSLIEVTNKDVNALNY